MRHECQLALTILTPCHLFAGCLSLTVRPARLPPNPAVCLSFGNKAKTERDYGELERQLTPDFLCSLVLSHSLHLLLFTGTPSPLYWQVGNKAKIEKEYGELEGRLTQLRSERDQLQGRVDVIRDRVGGPLLSQGTNGVRAS